MADAAYIDLGPELKPLRFGDQLSRRLAGLIERGEIAAGGRLPAETELAGRFGVSRPVVREALSQLREAGMIVSRKGAGSFVQRRPGAPQGSIALAGFGPISNLAQVRKCYQFRLGIEGESAFLAAGNAGLHTGSLREALSQIESTITDRADGVQADYAFHLAVARVSGNEFFEAVLRALREPIEFAINLSRSLSLRRPADHLRTVHAEHAAVVEAIESGDAERARNTMRAHIANTCRRVFEGSDS